jgi:hypothetical protein
MRKISKAERRSDSRVLPISVDDKTKDRSIDIELSKAMCLDYGRVRVYSDIDNRSGEEMTPIMACVRNSSIDDRNEVHDMFYGNMQSGMQTALAKERIQKENIVRMNREAGSSVG